MDAPLSLEDFHTGFLGNFISKGYKTNQLEVNTDEKTLRPIARLKEPRDLFALPKDKDNDCSQQAARWPTECQVLDERIKHITYNPPIPEPYNEPTGQEPKPRPVGEENGIVVFNYNPVSAVNYNKTKTKGDDSDDDSDISSSESRGSSPDRQKKPEKNHFTKSFQNCRSSSNSNDENDDDDDDDDDEDDDEGVKANSPSPEGKNKENDETDDIWANCSPPYSPSPTKSTIQRVEAKPVPPETNLPQPQTAQLEIFSRSSIGGSKFLTQVHPLSQLEYNGLWFESRFESGNLAKAVKITDTYYELYLRPDLYTSRSKQWFYFRVSQTKAKTQYRFSIVNLVKSDSLYNEGMRPLMYSTIEAKASSEGWKRCGENISYYRNEDENLNDDDEDNWTYTLTFNIEFPNDNDTVYLAHSYPYTYSDLQDYLMAIQKHPIKSKFCKLRLLCRSLAGNNVYYLTVTAPNLVEDAMKKKKAIVISARVHPSETPSSWMMKGLMDFITGESTVAKRLRHKFIFKLIPMLNPDGVIVGNTRNSLTGKDLNRQYRTVIRETYPSIWYTKAMIKRLIDECGVAMYCDMHAHSRRQNIFVYGCENRRNPEKKLTEQVFPLMMHKNVADKFSFEHCKFKIQRSKEGTGRIVMWMLGVTNSYTIEASFGGSSLGSRKGTHFSTGDYEHMGRAFCETLLDYCDENPNKERLRLKIIERLLKEGSSADEPLNIPLSDYSSDEGDTSSSSDNEGKIDRFSDLEGPCCQPLKAPPCSPDLEVQRRKIRKKKHRARTSLILDRNNKKDQRIPLDMPTTDPGSELFFSTDEEQHTQEDESTPGSIFPKSRRYLLHSDLQRRYIFSVGDNVIQHFQRVPPALLEASAKSAAHSRSQLLPEQLDSPTSNEVEDKEEDLSTLHKTVSSWQNVNQIEQKPIPKLKIQNLISRSTIDDKPKSKVWLRNSEPETYSIASRPNSWAMRQMMPRMRKPKDQDTHSFFNACSQKLVAWQQETEGLKAPSKTTITGSMYNPPVPIMRAKKPPTTASKVDLEVNVPKDKRQADAARIFNSLTKPNRNAISARKKIGTCLPLTPHVSSSLAPLRTASKRSITAKFKASGIVATAVQPSKAIRRPRYIEVHKPIPIPLIEPITIQVDNEKSFARRVKTKLKKKKSFISFHTK